MRGRGRLRPRRSRCRSATSTRERRPGDPVERAGRRPRHLRPGPAEGRDERGQHELAAHPDGRGEHVQEQADGLEIHGEHAVNETAWSHPSRRRGEHPHEHRDGVGELIARSRARPLRFAHQGACRASANLRGLPLDRRQPSDTRGRSGQTAPAWASTSPPWPTACTWPAQAWSTGWSWWKATGSHSSTVATRATWAPSRSRCAGRAAGPRTSRPSWSPTRTSTTSAPCPSCAVGTASGCSPATWRHATCGERCTNRPRPVTCSSGPTDRASRPGGCALRWREEPGTRSSTRSAPSRSGCPSISHGRRSRSPSSVTPVVTRRTSCRGSGAIALGDALATGHPTSARTGPQVLLDFFHHDPARVRETLRDLAAVQADQLLPGHGKHLERPLALAIEQALND